MSNSSKNFFTNPNVSISNSIILNNYSIQNLIFTHANLGSYKKIPINSNNYYKNNSNQISYSPTPKKTVIKKILPISVEQSKIFKNITPMSNYKSMSRLNYINIKRIPINQRNKEIIPKLISISKNEKKIEKHPQDSKKKIIKKKNIFSRNNTINKKIIKNSVSSRVLHTIKNPSLDHNTESFPRNSQSKKRKIPKNTKIICLQPKEKLNLKEFLFGEHIGKGTFGKIFSVKWTINNKNYAMKKEILTDIDEIGKRMNNCKIIQNFIKNTGSKGVIHLYGNLCLKKHKINNNNNNNNNNKENIINGNISEFIYYELMEKAERDWDKEINIRAKNKIYYKENELLNIMTQLITTLSLLEKNHITHRDIKPQNILVYKGIYKLGDFGEIRVLKRDGLIVQRVRGSELYMSPILFHGLHVNSLQVRHNTYKSDVFSLGMCLFYAASLTYTGVDSIRELTDMMKVKNIIFQFLSKRYSDKLINFIVSMLEINENKRNNFIQLEEKLKKL